MTFGREPLEARMALFFYHASWQENVLHCPDLLREYIGNAKYTTNIAEGLARAGTVIFLTRDDQHARCLASAMMSAPSIALGHI